MGLITIGGQSAYIIDSKPAEIGRTSTGTGYAQLVSQQRWKLYEQAENDVLRQMEFEKMGYQAQLDAYAKQKAELARSLTKVRDIKTGKILRTEIPTLDQHADLKYVIIDDICDGGRTFIELAKAIKGSRPSAKVYLVVTHGIFSAGFKELSQYFEGIYTTNSYREVADNEYEENTKTTTFNVF